MRPIGRGPYLNAIAQYAPLLFGTLFLVIIVALVRNWLDERVHPDQHQTIDIRRVHRQGARGLIQ